MGILVLAVLLNVSGISLPKGTVLTFVFCINSALSVPSIFELTQRWGIDYVAYLQQAGAVYHGETDYTKISSTLGPCFYPAGHIWHYFPVYWLHLNFENAEFIMKGVHVILHSTLIVYIAKIAYEYFDERSEVQAMKDDGS